MMVNGFDSNRYLEIQKEEITNRVNRFEKLYLEFGGKLCYDHHAQRVLPGYRPDVKIQLLKQLGSIEIIYCVSSRDIEKGRVRRDFGLTYDLQTLKDIGDIHDFGLKVNHVIITRYQGDYSTRKFKSRLENHGLNVYVHTEIDGYPNDIDSVIRGYDKQVHIPTTEKLVIVTGVGGGSGKMATALCQIHHDRKNNLKAGFAKFETFPIWNLAIDHPINTAYEAATADLKDVNEIDHFHLKAYGISSVNYNRDIENFSILRDLMKSITGEEAPFGYRSPTDMGVNLAGSAIVDDEVCRKAANDEIIRRYFRYVREKVEGIETQDTIEIMKTLMEKQGMDPLNRKIVGISREACEEGRAKGKGNENVFCGAAIQLRNGEIVKGTNSSLFHAESAGILNAIKKIAGIPKDIDLISNNVLENITKMKRQLLGKQTSSLNVEETIISLATSSTTNPTAMRVVEKLSELEGCEMHITHLPSPGDEAGLMRLNMNVTTDAKVSILPHFQ